MKFVFICTFIFFSLFNNFYSSTIKVPQDISTIQAAIDSSSSGDTVLVSIGTYYENINFKGKNIVLGSLFLTTGDTSYISQTIIDGSQQGCVVVFASGEDSTTVLTGFTLTNGFADEDSISGGGITCLNNSNPILDNIVVKDNSVYNRNKDNGGGILVMDSQIILNNSIISGNIARYGGGIYLENSTIDIINSIIKNNEARKNGIGGGVFGYASAIDIRNSEIVQNNALFYHSTQTAYMSSGGGLYLSDCSTIIGNSNISYNLSDHHGGGITLRGTNIKIYKTKITNNSAFNAYVYYGYDGDDGGGIYGEYSTQDVVFSLEDVLIENNFASGSGGGVCTPWLSTQIFKNVTIRNNICANEGGGIVTTSNLLFTDSSNCSIYNNKAKEGGNDIYLSPYNNPILPISIYLDTVTVSDPDDYHIYPISNIELHYEHALLQSVNSGLYVSPSGNNLNSGISEDEPLQTIDYALTVIKADSNNPKTINLLPGTYSSSSNGEEFPIYGKSYVSLKGEDVSTTILDGENTTNLMEIDNRKNITLENITIQNGYGENLGSVCIIGHDAHDILLKNMIIKNNYSERNVGGLYLYYPSITLINLTIVNNKSNSSNSSGGIGLYAGNLSILNSIITNNIPYNVMSGRFVNLLVAYSNISGGFDGIDYKDSNNINWLEGNIDADPLFVGGNPFDYNLTDNSPSINTGTSFLVFDGDTIINLSPSEYVGEAPDMGALESDVLISVEGKEELPTEFKLEQNYPNPFNPTTTIKYSIPNTFIPSGVEGALVQLKVYDILGREVATLVNKEQHPGYYEVQFDASGLTSGIYFYQLKTVSFSQTKKFLLMK